MLQAQGKRPLSPECLSLLFDTLPNYLDDIIIILDMPTWRVDYVSPNVERLLGIPAEEALQNIRLLGETVAGDEGAIPREELSSIPLHGHQCWEREHFHLSSGEQRWFRETVYHETAAGADKFVLLMSDRTPERQIADHLRRDLTAAKSANNAKSTFLSSMSHDIRTPMNAIVGFAMLLGVDADDPDRVREYAHKITTSSQHLLSLINDVLDMSKIESGRTSLTLSEFNLPELLEEVHTIILPQTAARNQSFDFQVQGSPAEELVGDKLHVNQILINLLSNAVKYTPEGGHIRFLVQELPPSSPRHACIRFIVEDDGMGMSSEFLNCIFDPFSRELNSSTASVQGTGLGMAITKNLVDLMGGTISVTSELGKGSTFTVELTFSLSAQSTDENFWIHHGLSRIFVVDDDEDTCLEIQRAMADTGVQISYATDGRSAVRQAIQAHRQGKDFHIILLDWKMPGVNGVETARQLRTRLRTEVPIIAMTAYDWSSIEDEARAVGINAFVPKPFFVSTFRRVVETLFSEKEMQEEKEHSLKGMLCLVAEDNELNAEILFEMLDMEGARCDLTGNGQEVLDRFLQSPPGHYDMILMDVQMPVMDGYEATRRIRACSHPDAASIPIIAMTANAFHEDVQNALDAGMNSHLAKPIDMEKMKDVLASFTRPDR